MAVGWGIHPRSCELAHELDATVGWGIHSRSCQLAHEVDAPVASGGHNMCSCGAGDLTAEKL